MSLLAGEQSSHMNAVFSRHLLVSLAVGLLGLAPVARAWASVVRAQRTLQRSLGATVTVREGPSFSGAVQLNVRMRLEAPQAR